MVSPEGMGRPYPISGPLEVREEIFRCHGCVIQPLENTLNWRSTTDVSRISFWCKGQNALCLFYMHKR